MQGVLGLGHPTEGQVSCLHREGVPLPWSVPGSLQRGVHLWVALRSLKGLVCMCVCV